MTKRDLALWAGILLGPLAWALSMGTNFALAPWACVWGWKTMLYVVTIVALVICAGSAALSWREWRHLGREMPGEAYGAVPRGRLMAFSGVILSAMAALIIIAQGIPQIMLGACQ
jgi:hypothetical protein